jgi:hypothetical protein
VVWAVALDVAAVAEWAAAEGSAAAWGKAEVWAMAVEWASMLLLGPGPSPSHNTHSGGQPGTMSWPC